MKLPEFILAHNRLELPGPVIIQTRPPYIVLGIRMEKTEDAFSEWKASHLDATNSYTIEGYNVAIYICGVLPGIPLFQETPYQHILQRAAAFYKTERLEHKPRFYKKYAKQ